MDAPNSKRVRKTRLIAEAARAAAGSFDNPMLAEMYAWALEQYETGNKDSLRFLQSLETTPVSIEEFLDSEDFMGSTDLQLWPEVRKTIVDACKYWWKGLGNGAVKEILLTGATGCVDADTEFLGRTGWKKVSEWVDGECILQYNPDGTANWVVPTEYHNRPAAYFYSFRNKTVNQMLTPGHSMVFKGTKSGKLITRSAEEVAAIHNSRVNGFSAGKFISAFTLLPDSSIPLEDSDLALMVAAIVLGGVHLQSGNVVDCRIYSQDSWRVGVLRKLLKEHSVPHRYMEDARGTHHVVFTAPRRVDDYSIWYSADQRQLAVIANEMLRWASGGRSNRLYTTSAETADLIQFVFTSLGTRTSIAMAQRTPETSYEEYCINLCSSPQTGLFSTNKVEVVKVPSIMGRCYCFTVPSGMWVMRRGGKIAATGNTGKSEIAKVVTAYHMHIIGCMKSVQAYYGLPSATGVVFPIQAAKPHVTKKVVYAPLRSYIEQMPWFRRHMRPSKLVESEMYFEKQNVRVVPGGAESDAILGEAIIGGIVDEINFMNVVEQSKKAALEGGRSGTYDQAQSVYDALTKRRKGRFITRGPHIGVMCISSSRRYRGDFTDRRQSYVEESGEEGVLVYDKAQYEARPAHLFCGETFRVALLNDAMGDIRILKDESEVEPRGATVFWVPTEYLVEFEKDPAGSVRDIIGRSTHAIAPFFRKRSVISDMFERGASSGLVSLLYKDNVILGLEGMPRVRRDAWCKDPSKPRYVHIDLSSTGDSCGICMVRYNGMTERQRTGGAVERLPSVTVELACSIAPDHVSEIDVAEVRSWVKQLKDVYGYPIKAVSYDGWGSLESRQQWRKVGMKTGLVSVDKTSTPYKQLREAMSDGRIECYYQDVLNTELLELEYDEKKDKVDHPPAGCFIGETLIANPFGPAYSFEEAVDGNQRSVWTYDSVTGFYRAADAVKPRITKYTDDLVVVETDQGSFTCTPDHRVLLVDGRWVAACSLQEGDEVKSLLT